MLLKALREFREIIEDVEVRRFARVGNAYELNVSIKLEDGSVVLPKNATDDH